MKYLFLLTICCLLTATLTSCNQSFENSSSGTVSEATFNGDQNSLSKVLQTNENSPRSLSADKKGNAEYEILYNNDSRTQSNFTVFIKNETTSDILDITENLFKKAKKHKEVNIDYFSDYRAAVNYVENQGTSNISDKEKGSLINNHIYKFVYIPNGKEALYQNVNNSWQEVKVN